MSFIRRAMLYSLRKKGKTLVLFLLVAAVSVFLVSCFSILNEAEALVRDIRKAAGAAFYIRANSNVVTNDKGQISVEENQFHITDSDIAEIKACGNIMYCNPIDYGYAKSEGLTFVPGEQDDPDNSMGRVTALSESSLYTEFAEKMALLSEGGHINGTSEKAIMISSEVAALSNLSVGDKVVLESARFEVEDGRYIDGWQGDRKRVEVTVIGIYDISAENTSVSATAAKQENRIYASLDVLRELGESEPSVYSGEVDFFVADPAELAEIVPKVHQIESIDWNTHFTRTNDFRYSKISGSIKSMSSLVKVLSVCISVVSAAVLTLILTFGIRDRIREFGILLAAGVPKGEILMQIMFETLTVAISAFAVSCGIWAAVSGSLLNVLFADAGQIRIVNEALGSGKILTIYICQFIVIAVSVLISSLTVLRFKPREILTKMS